MGLFLVAVAPLAAVVPLAVVVAAAVVAVAVVDRMDVLVVLDAVLYLLECSDIFVYCADKHMFPEELVACLIQMRYEEELDEEKPTDDRMRWVPPVQIQKIYPMSTQHLLGLPVQSEVVR